MKARVIKTGEIVDVNEDLSKQTSSGYHIFKTVDACREFANYELDFVNVYLPTNWQKVRIDASIAAMQANLTNPEIMQFITKEGIPVEKIAKASVKYADELVKELMKQTL